MVHFLYLERTGTGNSEVFANSVKRHICYLKNSQLRHDLPISVNYGVISPFREVFIFTKLRSFAKVKPSGKFPNLQYMRLKKGFSASDIRM